MNTTKTGGRKKKELVWTTKDGKEIPFSQLEFSHLLSILRMIERKSEEGVTIHYGGLGVDAEDMWYDEETIYGEDVLKAYHYAELEEELAKRTRRIR